MMQLASFKSSLQTHHHFKKLLKAAFNIPEGICIFKENRIFYTNDSILHLFDCTSTEHLVDSMALAKDKNEITLKSIIHTQSIEQIESLTDFTYVYKGKISQFLIKAKIIEVFDIKFCILLVIERTAQLNEEKHELINLFKSMLVSSLSHDLRTPLNIILSEVASVKQLNIVPPRSTAVLFNNAMLMNYLSQDMVDYIELECGNFTLRRSTFLIEKCINEVISLFQLDAESKKLRIITSFEPCMEIYADMQRITQIAINLVSNSIKYTAPGGIITITALIRQKAGNRKLKMCIEDNGLGMDKNTLAKIFNLYSNNNTKQFKTAGFGLTFSNKLANKMGGSLRATSKIGEGSMFILSIPFEVDKKTIISSTRLKKMDNEALLSNSYYESYTLNKGLLLMPRKKRKQSTSCSCEFSNEMDEPLIKQMRESINVRPIISNNSLLQQEMSVDNKTSSSCSSKCVLTHTPLKKEVIQHIGDIDNPHLDLLDRTPHKSASIKNSLSYLKRECGCPIVMAVDDNILNLNAFSGLSTILGLDCILANSGAAAVKLLEDFGHKECCSGIRIVFMDLDMPQMNGLEATSRILEKIPGAIKQLSVIILSAYSRDDKELQCLGGGAKDYGMCLISDEANFCCGA
jgi:two-component system sensor histidine kinase BarA